MYSFSLVYIFFCENRKAVLEFLPSLCLKKKLMDERNCSLVVKLISACSNIQEENVVTDLVNCILDSDRPSVRQSTSATRSASVVDSLKVEPDDEYSPTALKIEVCVYFVAYKFLFLVKDMNNVLLFILSLGT